MSIIQSTSGPAEAGRVQTRLPSAVPATTLLAVAAVLFILYPALRPYSSESGLEGATAFGSTRWVLAHVCGMVAFGSLAAAADLLTSARLVRVGLLLGVGLILPYYGAEAFGLHAIGQAALTHGTDDMAGVVDAVRNNPAALTMFGAGLIVLAIAGAALARVLWSASSRVGAALVGSGLVLYLPQFFGPPWVRVAHGALLGVGLLAIAVHTHRGSMPPQGSASA